MSKIFSKVKNFWLMLVAGLRNRRLMAGGVNGEPGLEGNDSSEGKSSTRMADISKDRKIVHKKLWRKEQLTRKRMTNQNVREALWREIGATIDLRKEISMRLIAQVTGKFAIYPGQTLMNMDDPDLDNKLVGLQGQLFTRGLDYVDAAPQPAKWDFKETFLQFVALYLELFVIQNTSHEKVKHTIGEHTLLTTSALQAYFRLQNEPLLIDIDNWLNFCFSLDGVFLEKILASDPFDESQLSLIFPRYARYLRKKIDSKHGNLTSTDVFLSMEGLAWHEVSITFVKTDTIRVDARATSNVFLCDNIGFTDSRTGEPNKPCVLLKIMAEKGTLPLLQASKENSRIKRTVSELRKKLRFLTGIEADPFQPFNSFKGYKPKFWLSDNTGGIALEKSETNPYYSLNDYEKDHRVRPQYRKKDISEDTEYDDSSMC